MMYMGGFADGQALVPEDTFTRCGGDEPPQVIGGPFVETKDLFAGRMIIDGDTYVRAPWLAGTLSAATGLVANPSTP